MILLLIYGFKLRSKFQKVIDIENKISRAFIVSVFFWSIYTILGINNSFRYFYSPVYNQIFTKDGFSFLTKNSDETKFIANKLKNGETDMKKISNELLKSKNKTLECI